MANIKGWFTMNGTHIPIMQGQSKSSAAKKFIASKKKDSLSSKELKVELDKLKRKKARTKKQSQDYADISVKIYNLEGKLKVARFREKNRR